MYIDYDVYNIINKFEDIILIIEGNKYSIKYYDEIMYEF